MSERSSSSSPSPSPSKSRNPRFPTQRFNAHFSFMGRKSSALKQAIVFSAFFILLLYAFVNTFFSPATSAASSVAEQQQQFLFYRENFLPFHEKVTGSYAGAPKVRVFMYDLPKQFTTGIIEQHSLARGSKDMSKATYPGHQHMGEWYMYSDLKRPESERVGSPIVRVNKPEEADLFYVPVFSSLSLIVNTGNPALAGPDSAHKYSDESMQEQLVDWLEKQKYWKRYNGRDHVIVASDPNALYRIIDRVQNAVLLLSDFGRVRPDQGSLMKDVIVPYSHRINTYQGEIGVENRNTLLFFMGNRYRKDGGKVRDLLFQMLEKEKDVIIKHGTQSRESRRAATHGMHTSKFCLNPAGDTPSACRLFDSIVSLCVPIIVSDSIELPFEDVIDYKKFTIFIETKTALKPKHLVKLLRAMPAKRILEYQKQMLRVRRYFEYDDPNGTVNEIWREIAQKLPLIQLMINRDKRLVRRELSEPDCSCLCTNMTGPITSF